MRGNGPVMAEGRPGGFSGISGRFRRIIKG